MARKKKQEAGLTDQQAQVIDLMIVGETIREAADAAGCSVSDVESWLCSNASFVAGLNSRLQDVHRANANRLRSMAGDAIGTLGELLQSDDESVRLRAATAVLKAASLTDVQEPGGEVTAGEVEREWARDNLYNFSIG